MIDDFISVKGASSKPNEKPRPVMTPVDPKINTPTHEAKPALAGGNPVLGPRNFNPSPKPKKRFWRSLLTKFKRMSWKQKLLVGMAALIIVGGSIGALLMFLKKPAPNPVVVVKKEAVKPPPKPTTEPSNLTGLTVPIEYNKLPVTGVMIENSPDARPQSGLNKAGVVFEAVAEGGITRFLALFQDPAVPDYIGPVRSARPYYLDYLGGFDAAVAHVGGSAEALVQIKGQNIKDLDQGRNSGSYRRISSRYAPHNVYTSMAQMTDLQKTKGYTSNYIGFPRKAKEAPTATPPARMIDLVISGYFYNVHYDYDTATNSYKRSVGGKPHIDERSGAQLSPKVVAVIVVPQSIHPDRVHTLYASIGSGKAYIFQDGVLTEGTWDKTDRKVQLHFKDASGAAIGLNAGQTWVTLVGTAGSVTYKP